MSTPLRRFGDERECEGFEGYEGREGREECKDSEGAEGRLVYFCRAVMEDGTQTAHGTRDTLMNEEPAYVIAMVYPSTSDLWFYTAVLLVFMWTSVRLWRRVRS